MSGRKIIVEGRLLEWLRRPYETLVRAWQPGNKRAPLRADFIGPAGGEHYLQDVVGWTDGWIRSGVRNHDLNRPAMAAALIRVALRRGWEPEGQRPFDLDGFALLREADHGLPHEVYRQEPVELATKLIEMAAAEDEVPPLAWLQWRHPEPWPPHDPARPELPLLIVAGLIELGFVLHAPAELGKAQREVATVWADARMVAGLPGGLTVAASLLGRAVDLDDAQAWAESLLAHGPSADG